MGGGTRLEAHDKHKDDDAELGEDVEVVPRV